MAWTGGAWTKVAWTGEAFIGLARTGVDWSGQKQIVQKNSSNFQNEDLIFDI